MYWGGVSGAAVSVGVQVVVKPVESLMGGLQQGGGAAAQHTWGAAAQKSWWASAQKSLTPAHQHGGVSAEEAVAAASHGASGAAVHEAGGPQHGQGGLCQGSLQGGREIVRIKRQVGSQDKTRGHNHVKSGRRVQECKEGGRV